jgi:hypothetical protein
MEVKIDLKQNYCKLMILEKKNVGMHYYTYALNAENLWLLWAVTTKKIKTMETVGVGGFNYIIVFFSHSAQYNFL